MSDLSYPGKLPERGDGPMHPAQFAGVESQPASEPPESTGAQNAQPSMADIAHANVGFRELPPDPVPLRMSSGAHFNPIQFRDQLDAGQDEPTVPDVHRNLLGWYGEGDQPTGGCNDR